MRVLILVLPLLIGCSGQTHLELGTGVNTSFFSEAKWENEGGAAFVGRVTYEWEHAYCQYSHYSQFVDSPSESSLDHFGCGLRVNMTKVYEKFKLQGPQWR